MSTERTHHTDHTGATYARKKLFILSIVALTAAGMVFSLRGKSMSEMETVFFKPTDPLHSAQLIGGVVGAASLGAAIALFVGSPLCDYLGMGRLLALACFLHSAGLIATILAPPGPHAYALLCTFMFAVGVAHGTVEAVINPLIATIYPDEKTHKLNVLHAWWPGGIVIGGLLAFLLTRLGLNWQVKLAVGLIPAAIYGSLIFGTRFPPTERVAARVPAREMLRTALAPLFILLLLSMMLTAASELGPGNWVDSLLSRLVGFQAILLLVYVSTVMFVMRHFAGSFVKRLSPIGLMWCSCLVAALGLLALSAARSPITGLLAATVWAIGVCYMWPTMLGITSGRFPKGGAFLMGVMGSAGNISIYFVLPAIGRVFDSAKTAAATTVANMPFEVLQKTADTNPAAKDLLNQVLSVASSSSFRTVAILPAILLVSFGAWWLWDRSHGGYRAEKLDASVVS